MSNNATDLVLFAKFLLGEKPTAFKRWSVSKSRSFKIAQRAKFARPFVLAVLNLSATEFRAVQDGLLKSDVPSKRPKGSFRMGAKNQSNGVAQEGDANE